MDAMLGQVFAGLSLGSVLLLASLGLALTFGQMGVINMAHGELIMAGAYTAYVMQGIFHSAGLSLWVSLVAGFVVSGLLGVLIEITLINRLYRRPLDTLLVTWGVSLILQQAARNIFGAPNVDVARPGWLTKAVTVGGVDLPSARVFILVLSVGCVAGLALVLKLTPLGRRIRAVVQNRDLAETSGVSTRATDRWTFFIGSGLAGVAGVGLTLIGSIGPTLGTNYIVYAFLVVVAGGIGSVPGTVIAAFGLGLFESAVEWRLDQSLAQVLLFALVIVFLQIRPQGLFATRTRSLA